MSRLCRSILMAAAGLLLATGCVQTKRQIALNADGRGKVKFATTMNADNLLPMGNQPKLAPDATARAALKQMVETSTGVDAWRDLDFTVEGDGKVTLSGVAYFPDLAKLHIRIGAIKPKSELAPQVSVANGVMTLQLVESPAPTTAAPAAELSEAEVKTRAATLREQYAQQLPMAKPVLTGLRNEFIFYLPGEVGQTVNFTKGKRQQVSIAYEGEAMLKAVETLAAQPGFFEEQVRSGAAMNQSPFDQRDINKVLFGKREWATVTTTGTLKDLFDYDAEMADAAEGFDAMAKKLKIEGLAAPAPIVVGDGFGEVSVIGVQWAYEEDNENDVSPFSARKGVRVWVKGELPGAVLAVNDLMLETITGNDGTNLMPNGANEKQIYNPNLSKDRQIVHFPVDLEIPPATTTGLKVLGGRITYVVADRTETVDLGTIEVAVDSTNAAKTMTVDGMRTWDGSTFLRIKIQDLAEDSILSVQLVNGKSRKTLPIESRFYHNKTGLVTVELEGEDLKKVHLSIEKATTFKRIEIPWQVGPVDWLGRPVK